MPRGGTRTQGQSRGCSPKQHSLASLATVGECRTIPTAPRAGGGRVKAVHKAVLQALLLVMPCWLLSRNM